MQHVREQKNTSHAAPNGPAHRRPVRRPTQHLFRQGRRRSTIWPQRFMARTTARAGYLVPCFRMTPAPYVPTAAKSPSGSILSPLTRRKTNMRFTPSPNPQTDRPAARSVSSLPKQHQPRPKTRTRPSSTPIHGTIRTATNSGEPMARRGYRPAGCRGSPRTQPFRPGCTRFGDIVAGR